MSRMIGAPPGYVGYDEAGQLTEAVRRRPYAVVLFDEIEKAHPEVLNVMLQLLDDGRLTDGKGRMVDFKNTVIVMTSNLRDQDALRAHFRPEFINRIDEIVFFHALDRGAHQADRRHPAARPAEAAERAEDQGRADARRPRTSWCREGYDPVYGARPLKRALQRRLLDPLALRVLEGEFREGDTDRRGRVGRRAELRERSRGTCLVPSLPPGGKERPSAAAEAHRPVVGARRPDAARDRPGVFPGARRAPDFLQRVQGPGARRPGGRSRGRRHDHSRHAEEGRERRRPRSRRRASRIPSWSRSSIRRSVKYSGEVVSRWLPEVLGWLVPFLLIVALVVVLLPAASAAPKAA